MVLCRARSAHVHGQQVPYHMLEVLLFFESDAAAAVLVELRWGCMLQLFSQRFQGHVLQPSASTSGIASANVINLAGVPI